VFGIVAAAVFLLYLPTVRYGFVWDDAYLVEQNESLARTNPVEIFSHGFWYNPDAPVGVLNMTYYRPLANLSLFLDRKVWGLNPAGFHLTNTLLHTAMVLLLCLLLCELFGSVWLAAAAGLLFGVHPAVGSTVPFVANRTYVLAGVALLASAYCLARGRTDRRAWLPVLLGLGVLAATLALEAALVFPVIAALWLCVRRKSYRRLTGWFTALALPIVVYFGLRFLFARAPLPTGAWEDVLSQPLLPVNLFGQQMLLLVVPFIQKVTYLMEPAFGKLSGYTILGLVFLLVPIVRLARKDAERATFGYAWLVLFLLPFAHLVPLGPSGRMLYLVAPGAAILVASVVKPLGRIPAPARRIVWGVATLYTLACGIWTARRNPIWRDEASLSVAKARENPNSAAAFCYRGDALVARGRADEAIVQYRRAEQIAPNLIRAHYQVGVLLSDRQDFAGAIPEFRAVVALTPDDVDSRTRLGLGWAQVGQFDSAAAQFRIVTRLTPNSGQAHTNLGLALKKLGEFDSAIAEYQVSLRAEPENNLTWLNLGGVYLETGRFRPAIAAFKEALRRKPDFESARLSLIDAYNRAGFPDSARLLEK
jgi:tetratricopeptide (TPR) repeat protein